MHQLGLPHVEASSTTRRANRISRRASRKRRARRIPRVFSDEIERDRAIPVEPLTDDPLELALYRQLRDALALRGTFEPQPGLPGPTRASCPADRTDVGCPYVRCRYHLARIDSCDRAGRPGLASVPRGARGRTLPIIGHAGDQRAPTTLEALWLRGGPMPHTCALDVAELGACGNVEVGKAIGRHRTLVAREVRQEAMRSALRVADEIGMTADELVRGLRELGCGG